MAIATADDGHKLWYEAEAEGAGPAIVFPARYRGEQAALAAALAAAGHHVVRYMPRHIAGILEPVEELERWDPSGLTRFPMEMELGDLHAVADAAGAGEFTLAGYSGMAAQAAFLAPVSDRATGLVVGGFPLLAGCDYWLGVVEGARTALLQAGLPEKAAEHTVGRLLYREWSARDDRTALRALPGPKILWYGSRDAEPDCRMYDYVGGSAIARHNRAHTPELQALGFTVIELEGLDHIAALAETTTLTTALINKLGEGFCGLSCRSPHKILPPIC